MIKGQSYRWNPATNRWDQVTSSETIIAANVAVEPSPQATNIATAESSAKQQAVDLAVNNISKQMNATFAGFANSIRDSMQ